MEIKKPLILIANDDGFRAKGIRCLTEMVRSMGDVIVCAPEGPRSGFSCAFTAADPLRLERVHHEDGLQVWACTGTPTDCIKMALSCVVPRRPDLILAGINHGDNASVNAHYSGTMGAVIEGCMKYIPSVAYSLCDHRPDANFEPLTPIVQKLTARVLQSGLPRGVCLNVNFPLVRRFKGIRACRMAPGTWGNEVVRCRHPRGYDYYWMAGEYTNDDPQAPDTDNRALSEGYVAITPTQIDLTHYPTLQALQREMQDFDFS